MDEYPVTNEDKIELNELYSQRVLETSKDILTHFEIEYLGISGALLAYIMGVRFLTDYLQGDVCYKTKHAAHNLDRSSTQLELVRQILERQEDIQK